METKRYITLIVAANSLPNRPSANAVWRWCRRGVLSRAGERVYLKHYRMGGKIFTTEDDLQHFFEALAEADRVYFDQVPGTLPIVPVKLFARQRKKRIKVAEQVLTDAGI